MRLRRFTAPTSDQALRDVKASLGEDALILSTRSLGAGGVEITAATDVDLVTEPIADASPDGTPSLESFRAGIAAPTADLPQGAELGQILGELRRVSASVRRIDRALVGGEIALGGLGAEAREIGSTLARRGLVAHLAEPVAATFEAERQLGRAVEEAMAASLGRHLALASNAPRARITAFVGPTGSGKTTTIAKLAAAHVVAGTARPGLVMADTYRVAAAEQLGSYARLLDVPMRVVGNAAELKHAIAELADRDAIYVDTAGLGGHVQGRELHELLAGAEQRVSVTAVLSATASPAALRRAWQQIELLTPDSGAVTKLDECEEIGAACSWLAEVGVPLRWIGTGQHVPEDLSPASGASLARWLLAA
jgi:flagellar biosynthesis protein FlhF